MQFEIGLSRDTRGRLARTVPPRTGFKVTDGVRASKRQRVIVSCQNGFRKVATLIAAAGLLTSGAPAAAGWTVTLLDPGGDSSVSGVGPWQQSGSKGADAGIWRGTPASWVSLHPPAQGNSYVTSTIGTRQAGQTQVGSKSHASLWSSTAASWVDIYPAAAFHSYAKSLTDSQQAGYVMTSGGIDGTDVMHACMWRGTAASWIDLAPGGVRDSSANCVAGSNRQGGYVTIATGAMHAALWMGTPASLVDLNPAGKAQSSLLAMTETRQGGYASNPFPAPFKHAGLWSGTAASWTDLNPPGIEESSVNAMSGDYQAGSARAAGGSITHAAFWHGTVATYLDLHTLLPARFTLSSATGIWTDSVSILVGGLAYNSTTKRNEAILWYLDGCRSDLNRDGVVDDADFVSFAAAYNAFAVPPANPQADLNHDDAVDDADFVIFAQAYDAMVCP